MQKYVQISTVSEKPSILSERFKTLTSSNYHRVEYFLLKLCTRLLFTKLDKNCKELVLHSRFLHFLIT